MQRPPERQRRSVAARRAPTIETIVFVLGRGGRPMRATEIHAAAEDCVGHDLKWSSVKNALSEHARRQEGPIRRIGYGVYELRTDA